ncbi:hypothetical protein [Streptomyces sp. NRRL S-920]|uniref:hypothetical protein n=1 Tax=Streptomyces sp. NRRL S-920 TaxID=1463921 RepID=UPI0004C4BA86|nr:hypothetical protein [Streptomyces sp. NRRL S-920]
MTRTKKAFVALALSAAVAGGAASPAFAGQQAPATPKGAGTGPLSPLGDSHIPVTPQGDSHIPVTPQD